MNNLGKLQQLAESEAPIVKAELSDNEDNEIESTLPQVFQLSPSVGPIEERKPIKIGVCGGHSAGKALFCNILSQKLKSKGYIIKVVKQDSFELEEDDLDAQYDNNQKTPVFMFRKDWNQFLAKAHEALGTKWKNCHVVIIEGTLIYCDEKLRNKMDVKIFLDADQDVRLSRKIYKESCIKQQDVNKVVSNYISKLKPLFENYINPSKRYADVVIPNFGGGFSLQPNNDELRGFETQHHQFMDLLIGAIMRMIVKQQEVQVHQIKLE